MVYLYSTIKMMHGPINLRCKILIYVYCYSLFLHAFKISMVSRRHEQFPERIFVTFIYDELESSLCMWKRKRTVAIAVLGTVLQRPFSFPEQPFSLIFLHSAKLKTEEESQIYCSETRRLYLHKIPSNLLHFIKTLLVFTGSLAKTPRQEKAARFSALQG